MPAGTLAGGSCEPRGVSPQGKSPALQLQRVTPAAGSLVDDSTLLLASISYSIPSWRGGQYTLSAQFDTNEPGVTVDGVFRGGLVVRACGPSGIFSFALPLENVYRHADVRRPLRFRFYLLEGSGGTREVIASSGIVEYSEARAGKAGK